jgi:ribosomal protein L34E
MTPDVIEQIIHPRPIPPQPVLADYALKIRGYAPELTGACSFRRTHRSERCERKIVKCPHCGGRLAEVDLSVNVELYRSPDQQKIPCQQYTKCGICHNEIGLILT